MSNTAHGLLVPALLLALGSQALAQGPDNVLRFYQKHGANAVNLVDEAGTVVHTWRTTALIQHAVDLMPDGSLVRNIVAPPNNGVERLAFDGSLLWDYRPPAGRFIHHDLEPMPNGNVLLIVSEDKNAAAAVALGRAPGTMPNGVFTVDSLIEVQPTGPTSGTIVWEWNVWDHLIQDFDNTQANFGVVGDHPELLDINYPVALLNGTEFNHVNGIDYDPIHDWIVLSSPKQNEIWIIDHSTTTAEAAGHVGGRWGKGGDLLYRWGNPQAYRAGPPSAQILDFQHDPQFVPPGYPGEGNVTMFNNRYPWGSSAAFEIELPVDPSGNFILTPGSAYGPAAPVWSYAASEFFSKVMSGCERLPNGNTLICSADQNWIFEVTPAGQRVWEINTVNGRPFHAHHTTRTLWADGDSLSAAQGGTTVFSIVEGTTAAADRYLMLCSASGTSPGFDLFGVHIPLNPDPFFQASASYPNNGIFVQSLSALGPLGKSTSLFRLPPALPGGYNLDFAYLLLEPAPLMLKAASNTVPVAVF